MNDQKYMSQTLDLFESMNAYIDKMNEKLDVMGDILLESGATLEKLTSFSTKTKSGDASEGGPAIDKLVNKIDKLVDSLQKGSGGDDKTTKIESKSIGDLGKNIGEFMKGINAALPGYIKSAPFIKGLSRTIAEFINELSENTTTTAVTNAVEVSKIMGLVSGGIANFGKDLAKSIPYYTIARPFIPFIGKSISSLINAIHDGLGDKTDPKRVEGVGAALKSLSGSVLMFGGAMALGAPLFLIAIPGILAFDLMVMVLGDVANRLSKAAPNIKKSTGALNQISLSILAFAGSVALSAMIIGTMDSGDAGSMLMLLGGIGLAALTFGIIGEFESEIVDGALSVLAMSGSLLIFSLAMAASVAVMSEVGIGGIGMSMLALAGTALVFGLAGEFWEPIVLGSLAFAAAGIALWIFAPQYERLATAVGDHPNALWQIPLAIIGIGGAFALAGIPAVAPLILLGSLAIAATGAALFVVASALEKFLAMPTIDEEKAQGIESGIKAVVTGFGKSFEDLSLTEALTLPLKIPVVGLMGLALVGLGLGLGAYLATAGKWSDDDSDTLKYTIQSLSAAFSAAGSPEGMTTLFGFTVGENDVERGIESTMRMGKNLKGLADGIMAWKKMELTAEDVQLIADNIGRVMNVIPGIFATIGQRENGSTSNMSFLGMTFENPFSSGDTEAGIDATMDMGENLKNLADSILAWKEMKLSPEDLQIIADNISRVMNTIPAIFAMIGQREAGSTGEMSFFGLKFSNPFSSGDTEAGIEATMGMGENLKELADGVLAWKDGGEAGFKASDLPAIKDNIMSVLSTIPLAFAKIGAADKATEGLLWGDGDVERGIDLLEDLSPSLKDISKVVDSFKEMTQPATFGTGIGIGIKNMLIGVHSGLVVFKDTEVERFTKIIKPLDKLAGIWKDINEALKDHVDYLGQLDKKYIDNFSQWADAMKTLSEVDPARLQQNQLISQQVTDARSAANGGSTDGTTPAGTTTPDTTTTPAGKDKTKTTPAKPESKDAQNTKMTDLLQAIVDLLTTSIKNDATQQAALDAIKTQLTSGTLKVIEKGAI